MPPRSPPAARSRSRAYRSPLAAAPALVSCLAPVQVRHVRRGRKISGHRKACAGVDCDATALRWMAHYAAHISCNTGRPGGGTAVALADGVAVVAADVVTGAPVGVDGGAHREPSATATAATGVTGSAPGCLAAAAVSAGGGR